MIKNILKSSISFKSGKWPHQYKAFNLKNKSNEALFNKLKEDNFFEFNIRNNGFIVYEHQVIAYYFCGGVHAFKRGFICDSNIYEIHHVNGNTFDNSEDNLIYIPRILHVEITTVQRSLCKYLKTFRKKHKGANLLGRLSHIPMWNKQGRPVQNIKYFVIALIVKTIKQSAITFNKSINKNYFKLWLKKISKSLTVAQPIWHNMITWIK